MKANVSSNAAETIEPFHSAMMKNSLMTSVRLFCTAAIVAFACSGQVVRANQPTKAVLPGGCGIPFLFEDRDYCVHSKATSSEASIIVVASPLTEETPGFNYRTYRILTSCRTAFQTPQPNVIELLSTRQVDLAGQLISRVDPLELLSPDSADGQLGWKAFQVSCAKKG
jgi:hypothetical protein